MEQEILQMLRQSPGTLFSVKEVGKVMDRKEYRENPNWARPILENLVAHRQVTADPSGYYFVPQVKKLGQIG